VKRLVLAALKTGSGNMVGILFTIITTKIFAVTLGPNGVGVLSLVRQFMQTANVLSTASGSISLVQGVSSREEGEQYKYAGTVLWLFLFISSVTVSLIFIFAGEIGALVFGENVSDAEELVRWLSVAVFLTVISSYLSGLLNAFRFIGYLAIVKIVVSLVNALLAYPISFLIGSTYFVAFAWMMIVSQVVSICYAGYACWTKGILQQLAGSIVLRRKDTRHFFSLAGAVFFGAMLSASTILWLRSLIATEMGISSASFFDVAWTISMTYVMLALRSLGTYYMPTLSKISTPDEKCNEIEQTFRFVLIAIVPLITVMIIIKPWIISLLYSQEFISALDIVKWMLIGDLFKAIAWVLAMPMISFADKRMFIVSELIWTGGFALLAGYMAVSMDNIEWIGIVFLINYSSYFIFTLWYVRFRHGIQIPKRLLYFVMLAVAVILSASIATWHQSDVDIIYLVFWTLLAMMLSWFLLLPHEKEKIRMSILWNNKS